MNMQLVELGCSSIEEVTPMLRWKDSILQQAWTVTHYKFGTPHKITTEWRDVPTEKSSWLDQNE